jgi:hypothetical protein
LSWLEVLGPLLQVAANHIIEMEEARMGKTSYFGRDGRQIQMSEWSHLRANDEYRVVRKYDNGTVFVKLEWLGEVRDAANLFKDHYPLFVLSVSNYDAVGNLWCDPVDDGKTFATERDGIEYYEAFLERWTNSHRDENNAFVEEDNIHTPPPPPDPDAPSSEVSSIKLGVEDDGAVW